MKSSLAVMMVCIHLLIGNGVSTKLESSVRGLNNRIIGGTPANPTRYPYFTYLRRFFQSGIISFCGGSLVNPDVILTAAHCIKYDDDPVVKIKAYVNCTQSLAVTWNLTEYVYERDAIAWIPHPKNNGKSYDIGLIILKEPVFEVTPVKRNSDGDSPKDGNPVTAIGHGLVSQGTTPGNSLFLNMVNVSIVSMEDCNDYNSWNGNVVNDSMICAGVPTGCKDTCSGDSGGPLLVSGQSHIDDLQVGITSWGMFVCGHTNYPGVYTRVSYYNAWINDTICQHSNVKPSSCMNSRRTKKPNKKPIKKPTRRPTKVLIH
jgi:trypsin